MAQSPAPVPALEEKAVSMEQPGTVEKTDTLQGGPSLEDLKEIVGNEKKPFSVTDKEYEKMRAIEGDLLGDL